MEISPAAGPLTDSLEPAKKLTTIPPIIAETTPKIGGKSAALATPILNGNANKNTKNPARASLEKFCFNPAKPSAGILCELILINIFSDKSNYSNSEKIRQMNCNDTKLLKNVIF